MASSALQIVIPLRDRAGQRLDNCLRSLAWQDGNDCLDVTISDYGSNAAVRGEIAEAGARHGARVVHTETTAPWSRSRALNIGIRAGASRHVLCTDVDMLFAADFTATALSALREAPGRLVVCDCHDLPRTAATAELTRSDFDRLRSVAERRATGGTGACHAADRSLFEQLRGYDEAYLHWGYEDADLLARAQAVGADVHSIATSTTMLHQWHPRAKDHHPGWFWRNRVRYWLTRNRPVKNRRRWGGRP
jgi:hypothetical protein